MTWKDVAVFTAIGAMVAFTIAMVVYFNQKNPQKSRVVGVGKDLMAYDPKDQQLHKVPLGSSLTLSSPFLKTVDSGGTELQIIIVTPERKAVLDRDEVIQFVQCVNDNAAKRSYWHEDYQRAHYDAFLEESFYRAKEVLQENGLDK